MSNAALARIDHLVYGTHDLESTIVDLEERWGVRAALGGAHPGRGTRNALLALGPASYLEILAPDPEQPAPAGGRWLGIDAIASPRLTTWAANAQHLEQLVASANAHDIPLGPVRHGQRTRTDGATLSWQLTDGQQLVADGLVPFFIDWGHSPHPAASAPTGLTLLDLRAEHPQPELVRAMYLALGLEIIVTVAARPAILATIRSPRGMIELR